MWWTSTRRSVYITSLYDMAISNADYYAVGNETASTLARLLGTFIDIDYSSWVWRILMPLIITFLLPLVFVLLIYLSSLFLYVYKLHRTVIYKAVSSDLNYWNVARKCIAAVWDAHSWIYHGYEVVGLDNIPKDGPALIVYYHGAIPIDMYYLVARVCMVRDRLIHTVGDRFLFKLPGYSIIAEAMKVIPGTVPICAGILKEDNLLAISPGGVYEAQFGNNNYELLWRNRYGFAKVAIEAKAPIIPMFTENLREAFRCVNFLRRVFIRIYNATKIPVRPIYGGFPVKLRTYLGEPIPYDPSLTPEQLQQKVALAIEELIQKHQRIPGSIVLGLFDRFVRKRKQT